jgi:prepilin-type N-terminal cleavage/methylation domain-containing protein
MAESIAGGMQGARGGAGVPQSFHYPDNMSTYKHSQSGFSLVELLLALGIGVLVMAAAFAAYDTRRSDAEVNVLDADIDALIYKANMAYSNSNQYVQTSGSAAPLTAQRLNDAAGGLPNAFIADAAMTSGFSHFWGGEVSLGAASTNGGTTRDLLTITLADIPPSVCIDLVGRLAPRMYDTRVDGTLVGLQPARTAARQGRNAIRVAQVAPLCAGDENDIVFRYLKPLDYSIFRSLPVTTSFTPGETPGSDEETAILGNYNRIEAAINNRETAQLAIP